MSQDEATQEPEHGTIATKVRSAASAANSLIQMGLLVIIFVVANFAAAKWYLSRDFSPNELHTLSETTRKVIASIDSETRIIAAFSETSSDFARISELTELFDDAGGKKISAEVLDPVRNPNRAREISTNFKHEFRRNSVLLIKNNSLREIPEEDLFLLERDQSGQWVRGAFIGEDAITSALLSLQRAKQPVLYILTGKGSWPRTNQGTGADILATLINQRQGINVRELSLKDVDAIPDDASAIILVNARYDFNGRELGLIRKFFEERKGGVITLLNPTEPLPNFEAFLRLYGIHVGHLPVVTRTQQVGGNDLTVYDVPIKFLAGPEWMDSFLNVDTVFPGRSCFLKIDEGSDELIRRKIEVASLALSPGDYWAESKPDVSPAELTIGEDSPGPLTLAAMVEKGNVDDARLRVRSSRMVVIANPHLLDPPTLNQANVDFLFSAISWTMNEELTIGITPPTPSIYRLQLKEGSHATLSWVVCGLLPAATLILGFLVFQRRRA